ncbi:MAG: hypothetical protein OXP28_11380 [Gammaproteobacteria bacterium]|nr:hypothetical protein [Gammaproteobacteria bacterium]MDE0225727.1 hypothetical protein [Gammaproteobacteria bacterium]MDE0452226.1 hypothetical protein [Gammaproteobacteria bacterium]
MADIELVAYLHDAASRRLVDEVDAQVTVRSGTVRTASARYRTDRSPEVLLIDLDGEQNPIVYVPALMQVCRPETIVIATGSENNVSLANELYRGGIFLYLPKPLDALGLRNAMREVTAIQTEEERPEVQTCRVMLIHGKGMGTNTVTTLLARSAADAGRYVSCLDIDPSFGSLSLAFDTQPMRGLAQALETDGEMRVEQLQAQVSSRIGLVAHPVDQAGRQDFDEKGLPSLVEALSLQAHMVLISGAQLFHLDVLRTVVSSHVVVFEPTPAGVSIAIRWLRILDGEPSTLVMNHTRPLPRLISQDQLRSSLGGRLPDFEIPYIKGMSRAMALGEPETAVSRRERAALNRFLLPMLGLSSAEEVA